MSNTQYIFLKKVRVPSRAALQASIDALGFDLKLHPELDLLTDFGFSPCVLNGIPDVGFELESAAAETLGWAKEIARDNDYYIGMAWHGSMKDGAAGMIASCALAKDFGAIVSYEGQPPESFESLLQTTREILQEAMSET